MRTNLPRIRRSNASPGFTLVEMLVAVALVLLLMSMFAQVFQIAGNTMSKQRGIAENDQRTRTLQNIIKGDLDKRTFRKAVPWVNQEDPGLVEAEHQNRRGYLYISENDPASETDDFLQLTVQVRPESSGADAEPFYGKATVLGVQTYDNMDPGYLDPTMDAQSFEDNLNRRLIQLPNQPEADDGRNACENGLGAAPAAEIAYFLRNGSLYRRVLLIRELPPSQPFESAQPQVRLNDGTTWNLLDYTDDRNYTLGLPIAEYRSFESFWRDFDYSAVPFPCVNNSTLYHARFHGIADLDNKPGVSEIPFGNPLWRFGHFTGNGRSREWETTGNITSSSFYVGRLTQEETSSSQTTYPHGFAGPTVFNPMGANYTDGNGNGAVDSLENGPRRGEDLLLPNVHGFDIKVWDDGANAFVDIGGPNAVSFSTGLKYRNYGSSGGTYGPTSRNDRNNVFDTWYPGVPAEEPVDDLSTPRGLFIDFDGNGVISPDIEENLPPPFVLRRFRPTNDRPGTLLPPTPPPDLPNWQPNSPYSLGDVAFPAQADLPRNNSRVFFRVVDVVGSGQSAATAPPWTFVPGQRVIDRIDASNYLIWEAVDNWRPLRAIQITVRFFDIPSDQMRQLTIVHNLIDSPNE